MQSHNTEKRNQNPQNTGLSEVASAEKKMRFGMKLYPETMKMIDDFYTQDKCFSRSEFVEKAVRFYCGYLMSKENLVTDFLAPQIGTITEGIVKGSEQKICRAMFKMAVELGAVTHMLAAMNQIDEKTLFKLRSMCTDEVHQINGVINFEKAVRYQHEE